MKELDTPRAPTPWYWKNPLANKLQQASVISTSTGVIQEFTTSVSDFTTTDTSSIHEVLGVYVRIPSGPVCIFAFANFAAKHSIGGGSFDMYLTLDDGAGGVVAFLKDWDVYLPSAGTISIISLSRSASASDMNSANIPRNRKVRLSLYVQMFTPGTLTIPGTSGNHIPSLTCFVTGDSSQ